VFGAATNLLKHKTYNGNDSIARGIEQVFCDKTTKVPKPNIESCGVVAQMELASAKRSRSVSIDWAPLATTRSRGCPTRHGYSRRLCHFTAHRLWPLIPNNVSLLEVFSPRQVTTQIRVYIDL